MVDLSDKGLHILVKKAISMRVKYTELADVGTFDDISDKRLHILDKTL